MLDVSTSKDCAITPKATVEGSSTGAITQALRAAVSHRFFDNIMQRHAISIISLNSDSPFDPRPRKSFPLLTREPDHRPSW